MRKLLATLFTWFALTASAFATTAQMRDANLTITNSIDQVTTLNIFTAARTLTIPSATSINVAAIRIFDTANAISTGSPLIVSTADGSLINGYSALAVNLTGASVTLVPAASGYYATVICPTTASAASCSAANALAIFDFRNSMPSSLTFSRGTTQQDFGSSKILTSFGNTNPAVPLYNFATNGRLGIGIWSSWSWRGTWARDFTQAAWVKTNVTAALTQIGIDGTTNSASLLTATAGNGTALQSLSTASFAYILSAYVKRVTGTGQILMTLDGGTTTVDVSNCINTNSWVRVPCNTDPVNGGLLQTLANPNYGFKIVTSGDAVAVDYVQAETQGNNSFVWPGPPLPIVGVSSGTRNADSITIPLANISGLNTDSFTIVAQYILPYWQTTTSTCFASATTCPLQAAAWEVNDGTANNAIISANQPGQSPIGCNAGTTSPCDDDFNVQTFLNNSSTTSKARASTVPSSQLTGLIHPVAGSISTVAICYNQATGMSISATNGAGADPTPEVTTTNPGYAIGQLASWILQIGSSKRISSLNGYMRWLMVFNGCNPGNGTLTNQVTALQGY